MSTPTIAEVRRGLGWAPRWTRERDRWAVWAAAGLGVTAPVAALLLWADLATALSGAALLILGGLAIRLVSRSRSPRSTDGRSPAFEALRSENATLKAELLALEEWAGALAMVGEMSDRLQTSTSTTEAHALIAHSARHLFPNHEGGLFVTSSRDDAGADLVSSWGAAPWPERLSLEELAVRERPIPSRESLSIPIASRGRILAVVCLCARPGAPELDRDARAIRERITAAFARQVGLALTNVRLKETLQAQAIRDPLTHLYNRRFLDEALERELARAIRTGGELTLLMIDLDHFKSFNDEHGHAAGDAVLRAFATRLRHEVRASDVACRYGGEELALILPGASLDQAVARATALCELARGITVPSRGQTLRGVTVSIGVASSRVHGDSPDSLLRAADAALYAAKAGGRDGVRVAVVPDRPSEPPRSR